MNTAALAQPASATRQSSVVFGRFMLPDMSEHACQVTEISASGAVFLAAAAPQPGLSIVSYLEELGRVEVVSGEPVPGGFRVNYSYSGARLERLLQRIDWLRQREAGTVDQRRHQRFEPKDRNSHITMPDGRTYPCEVLDISVSGAGIKTEVMPRLGTYLMVGKMKGRVVRYLPSGGVGIQFIKPAERPTDVGISVHQI